MKLTTTRNIDSNLGSLETHRVSIAANGKAFSTLVKGIYENKIRAFVREISTNALDSHIQAGIEDTPFHVSFPDIFDPYFRVRDYGVSMTHEQVFAIFGTLFESTKDQSNDVVGAFGLGSKSPLAYADSFNVTAFLDGEMRVYLVTIDETGAPTISLLATEDTDKPDGIEVAVPIREADFSRVTSEGRDVLSAFDVLPTCNIDLDRIEKLFEIEGAYVIRHSSKRLMVRQGCVMYPVGDWDLINKVAGSLNYNYSLVLDVPIGTVGVTTSREALELDEQTRKFLIESVANAVTNIGVELAEIVNSQPNLLEANRFVAAGKIGDFWGLNFQYRGKTVNGFIELMPNKVGKGKRWETRARDFDAYVQVGTGRKRRSISRMHVKDAATLTIVTDYADRKVARSALRYRELVGNMPKDSVMLLTNPSRKLLARLTRLLGLKKEQIIWVGSLPDPGPVKRGERRNSVAKVQGVRNLDNNEIESMPEDFYWMVASRPDYYERIGFKNERSKLISNGGDDIPLLVFTPSAAKRYDPNIDRRVDKAFRLLLESERDNVRRAYKMVVASEGISRFALEALEVEVPTCNGEHVSALFDWNESDAIRQEAKELRAEWKKKLPLLIDPDESDWQAYVELCLEEAVD